MKHVAARARVEKALGHVDRQKARLILDSTGVMRELHCKCCDDVIGKLVASDIPPILREIGGRKVLTVPTVFMRLPLYREIRILFDDGSAHVSNVCRCCAVDKKLTVEELEKMYCEDMLVWASEEGADRVKWDWLASRKPVSYTLGD